MMSFNPTMVRLLPASQSRSRSGCAFQSHNGAIAALGQRYGLIKAQPVSIPQWCDCCLLISSGAMRSLSVSIPQWCDCCATKKRAKQGACRSFNPTMVRLLQVSWKVLLKASQSVSIPQWCDCCQGKILGFEGKRERNGEGVAVDLRLPENP